MSKIWITSDHHFFHRNIIDYCKRPFSDEYEMNEILVEKWNEKIGKNDLVVHGGDFFAGLKGRYKEARILMSRLNGRIILIRGNHDHLTDEEYKGEFGFIYVDHFYIYENLMFCHYPLIKNPDYPDPIKDEMMDLLTNVYVFNDCSKIFHGHNHNTFHPNYESHYNIAVDRNNFEPIDLLEKVNELGWQKINGKNKKI